VETYLVVETVVQAEHIQSLDHQLFMPVVVVLLDMLEMVQIPLGWD